MHPFYKQLILVQLKKSMPLIKVNKLCNLQTFAEYIKHYYFGRTGQLCSVTCITALQNSREFMNCTRAGDKSQSSFRRQCHSSPFSSSFVGNDE